MKNLALFVAALCAATTTLQAQTSGGPDTYGYTWTNSDDAQGPTYNWIDITSVGTQISGLADDNSVAFIPMTQPFHYYWSDYSQIKIGSNGWLAFDNVSNIASCFPSLPTAGGVGDNFLAPFMSDLIYNSGSPGEAWYYDDIANDRFIISFLNVPWWSSTAPGYMGSNTFQVILSTADSSITYQYQTLSSGFNTGCVTNLAVGIENMTGNIGLEVYSNFVPANNHAVRFEYPPVVTFQVQDSAPEWSQNTDSKGTFETTSSAFSKDISIKNYGNTDITTDIIVLTELLDLSMNQLWSSSDTIPSLNAGQSQTITYANLGPFTAGQYYFRTTTTNGADLNPGNNTLVSEIEVVDNTTNPVLLSYATQGPFTGTVSWTSGGGAGIYIVPPSYPMLVDSVSMYIANVGFAADYNVYIMDDDGTNGAPGTILSSQVVTAGSYITDSWVTTVLPSPILITSGGFYIGWDEPTLNSIALGYETDGPISRQSLEYLGSWATYRSNETNELMMNAYMTNVCTSVNATVDAITDVACNGDQTGAIDVTVSGAYGSVNYAWSNGAGTNEDPSGLAAGTYVLTYSDSLGCSDTLSATITEPTTLTYNSNSLDEINGSDGTIDLTVFGGTGPYTFLWSNAATTEDLNGLTGGIYTCTITDANGCTLDASVTVNSQVGLGEFPADGAITIFPNPNSGAFNITTTDEQTLIRNVSIVNATGQLIWETNTDTTNVLVNATLPAGVYFVKVKLMESTAVMRIIVQ